MTTSNELTRTIAIIGGGVSGALTAFHLIRQRTQARLIIIDRRPDLGLGLAYSTPSLRHLLNVPAGKISALPDQPDHFLNWLRKNHDSAATEKTFAPRAVFGRYIQSLLATTTGLRHEIATVTDLQPYDAGAVLTLDNGCELRADLIVLATGNFDPAPLPGITKAATESGLYHNNAWLSETYARLGPCEPVALVGTGLTGVDVLLRLRERGHRGKIIAVSRHGVFPNRHEDYSPLNTTAIPLSTPATCVAYLRALRTAIRNSAEWRAAIDSLRETTNDLWLRLPIEEQKRFRRHLQRRWEVVRHRMAPPIADIIEAELRNGTLEIREGHLHAVDASPAGAQVTVRTGIGKDSFYADRVINCTGPSMNYRRTSSTLLHNLFEKGLVIPGPLGAGFHCAENGALIDASGQASETIFNLGPGRLGDLLESIAIPEIRQQAVDLAFTLKARLSQQSAHAQEIETDIPTTDAVGEWVAA
ncbi:FAD/NAD(P)-binding protein [Alloacidobacterium dinghuense]|uniref:FAD/NAD(P)-binding protein n=1 Tax=Alloacidobacterium dinghuense TaxID=2763107 RepID=A0A7G8BMH9_9BACT|nr:FAD/NAD(P)-binding protein [Alloacidobacterium dinghuense]QNI33749.1 FAD/NAD(P)-binding protein [Alloacidobacterium dinghuense]